MNQPILPSNDSKKNVEPVTKVSSKTLSEDSELGEDEHIFALPQSPPHIVNSKSVLFNDPNYIRSRNISVTKDYLSEQMSVDSQSNLNLPGHVLMRKIK